MQSFKNLAQLAFLLSLIILGSSGCRKDNLPPNPGFMETMVDLQTHKLKTFSHSSFSKYLIVFESGLGDDHGVWAVKNIPGAIAADVDILMYDRGGYGASEINAHARGIRTLGDELSTVINHHANGKQVILVGHSLGGMIIRDYAIKYPEKTAALLFIDASHELYNSLSQDEEDKIYQLNKEAFGENSGVTRESRELVENIQYMSNLPNLPDIPVVAITSMRIDTNHDTEDKQLWYQSKEELKTGVSDFTHITTTKSGHYIMLDEPQLVIDHIKLLLAKLP